MLSVNAKGIATAIQPGTAVLSYKMMNGMNGQITLHVRGENMNEIVLPTALTVVETESFRGNVGLQHVIIGIRVEEIQEYAFAGCTGLRIVDIQNGNCTVPETAFADCDSRLIFRCPTGSALEETLECYGWTVNP